MSARLSEGAVRVLEAFAVTTATICAMSHPPHPLGDGAVEGVCRACVREGKPVVWLYLQARMRRQAELRTAADVAETIARSVLR